MNSPSFSQTSARLAQTLKSLGLGSFFVPDGTVRRIFQGSPSLVKHFRSQIQKYPGNALRANSRFRTVGDPQTLENKADSLPRLVSELCYPQYGWYRFFFWKGTLHGTARAGHEIPNSSGGTSENTIWEENFANSLTAVIVLK